MKGIYLGFEVLESENSCTGRTSCSFISAREVKNTNRFRQKRFDSQE